MPRYKWYGYHIIHVQQEEMRLSVKRLLAFVVVCLISSCSSSQNTAATTTAAETTTIPAVSYLANCTSGDYADWGKSVEPSEIYINGLSPCMNNGIGDKIEITNWTTWSSDVATGTGRFGVNTYFPSGADENYDFYDITITLDSPINGFFSKMHLSWTVQPPTAAESYDVQPITYDEATILWGPGRDCEGDLGWTYNDSLPIEYCNQGRGVENIQTALGLEADGYFGRDTWTALGRYQQKNGLTEFGIVGPETWAKLFPYQGGLPGHDYNGDGLVTPDEFGE